MSRVWGDGGGIYIRYVAAHVIIREIVREEKQEPAIVFLYAWLQLKTTSHLQSMIFTTLHEVELYDISVHYDVIAIIRAF